MQTIVKRLMRKLWSAKDPNFLEFPKYRRSGAYHWKEIECNQQYKQLVTIVASRVHKDDRCLDLGCGDGAYMGIIADRCRYIVGVDADWDAITLARQKLREHAVRNARIIHRSIGRLGRRLRPSSFNVVYSMDVIEHLPEPNELLQVAEQLCHPDGRVIIGTPLFINEALVSKHHIKEFTEHEMNHLAQQHLRNWSTRLLPLKRQDGRIYQNAYYVGVGQPRG